MSCMYVVILCCLLMITTQTVYTAEGDDGGNLNDVNDCTGEELNDVLTDNTKEDSNDHTNGSSNEGFNDDIKSFVNYSQLKKLITRSEWVFINGKLIFLDVWLKNIIENKEDENDNENSRAMYTFVKCECADYIKTETKKIYELLENCPSGVDKNDPDKCKEGISDMIKLNVEISLTMTTLLAINDNYPNLKSHEPYFFKTLLMTYLYIKRNEMYNDEIPSTQDLLKMRRIVFQITNLIHGFTTEHCYRTTKDMIEEAIKARIRSSIMDAYTKRYLDEQSNNSENIIIVPINLNSIQTEEIEKKEIQIDTERVSIEQPNYLHTFLTTVVTLDPQYSPINIDDFMLSDCVKNNTEYGHIDLRNLCRSLSQSKIQRTDVDVHEKISIYELYALIRDSYDVEPIFEYMLAVYKIILKLIYTETQDILSNDIQEDNLFSLEEYEELIRKLKLMNCPIEIIHHYELLLKIETYKNDVTITKSNINENAKLLSTIKINSLFYVDINRNLCDLKLPLKKFMGIIFNVNFKQFWSIFSLLYRESETRSSRAYNLSLDLFPEGTLSFLNTSNGIKCNALIVVYTNFFKMQSMNQKSVTTILAYLKKYTVAALNDTVYHFKQIRERNTEFAGYLQDQLSNWSAVNYLSNDDDLLNIIINAIVHLKNEYKTDVDKMTIFNTPLEDLVTLLINKHEQFNRIGEIIMNSLDNYQIRKCKVIKDRDFIYENEYNNNDNYDDYFEYLTKVNFYPSPSSIFDAIFGPLMMFRLNRVTSRLNNAVQSQDSTNIYYKKHIPRDFYDFSKLTANDRIEEFKSLGTDFRFNWNSDMKSIREIQIDILENMLNIRDLVKYQRIYIQGTFLFLLERLYEKSQVQHNNNQNSEGYTFFKTISVLNSINFPQSYEIHTSNSNVIFEFYRILNSVYNKKAPNMFGIACPMSKIFGVIQVSDKKFNDRYNDKDVCSIIFSSTPDISYMINENAILFQQSLQKFKFTIPNY